MTEQEYDALPGLRHSALKDLEISPLRFWHRWINPEREPEKPTPAQKFGTMLHSALLEPDQFSKSYEPEIDRADYPDALETIGDLRKCLTDAGFAPKGTRKDEIIKQVQQNCPEAQIWDVIEREHAEKHTGKVMVEPGDWKRCMGCLNALREEPSLDTILNTPGAAEHALTGKEGSVWTKCRIDWLSKPTLLDIKTFTQHRGRTIEQAVSDAIWYEKYYRQACFYRGIALQHGYRGDFVFVFVESDPPHEIRLRSMQTGTLYWETARLELRRLLETYAITAEHFGEKPWRYAQPVTPLEDGEMKQLAYS